VGGPKGRFIRSGAASATPTLLQLNRNCQLWLTCQRPISRKRGIPPVLDRTYQASSRANFPRLMDSECAEKVVFTAPCWCADYLAIPSSCRRVSVYNSYHSLPLGITSGSHHCLLLLKNLWHVTIAHSIRAMRACRRPQLMVLVVPYPARFV